MASPTALRGMQRVKLSDKEEVERARLHLVALLREPYYRAAAHQLQRHGKLKEMIGDKGGKPTIDTLLAKQSSAPRQKKSDPGRPHDENIAALGELLDWLERNGKSGIPIIVLCRTLCRRYEPTASEHDIETVAKRLQRKLIDFRRRKKDCERNV